MKYVLDKTCRKSQDTHFVLKDFFSKIVPYTRMR